MPLYPDCDPAGVSTEMGTPDSLEPMHVKTRGIVYPELLGPRHHCPPGPVSVWSGLTPSLRLLMLSFRRHLHISLAQKEKVLWGRISGKSVSVSISPLTLEPQTTQVPLPLAALWPPGVEGDWLGLQWLYHFTVSFLRVLEGLGPGGGRKFWPVKRKSRGVGKPAPKLRPKGGFRQNLGEPSV